MINPKLLMVTATTAYVFVFYTLAIRPLFHSPTAAEDVLITLSSIVLFSALLIHAILGFEEEKTKHM
ncbi:uncharacterized protein Eint_041345 [Encephalitozoon intestinalis ATCC 50506]|uniref:Uncharacterized protein n=1 Tax=Encephalitozoon intestinalis (strain ATCC 50506) TaxID=876142 RepID=W8P976_ENCIT|nr:uncharacterized protein Eint_041345 [Encephalitozoon intestinalis ATCC 50506]AHL30092.1 hypothetical protein Eint_041345 [Encephalitozoon intestinalis ATCC 50506]UTX45116.1 hypothetical protein GPK93_04g06540 [Encephalitozoon intestinalis]